MIILTFQNFKYFSFSWFDKRRLEHYLNQTEKFNFMMKIECLSVKKGKIHMVPRKNTGYATGFASRILVSCIIDRIHESVLWKHRFQYWVQILSSRPGIALHYKLYRIFLSIEIGLCIICSCLPFAHRISLFLSYFMLKFFPAPHFPRNYHSFVKKIWSVRDQWKQIAFIKRNSGQKKKSFCSIESNILDTTFD